MLDLLLRNPLALALAGATLGTRIGSCGGQVAVARPAPSGGELTPTPELSTGCHSGVGLRPGNITCTLSSVTRDIEYCKRYWIV